MASAGDDAAFTTLVTRFQPAVFRWALIFAHDPDEAEDITQEVFLTVLRDTGYEPERGTLAGYLFGIARKLVLRHLERGRLDVALEGDLEEAPLPALA